MPSGGLSIGDLATATGVAPGTLRMWEARHGFPVARRRAGGHRRYDREDVERVARMLEARADGLSLAAAIDRERSWAPDAPPSLFAALRERQPELPAQRLPVPAMRALSHAIEDECLARARRPIVVGSFQDEHAYRRAQGRWSELARTASLAFVLAGFPARRAPRNRPIEVPLEATSVLRREWAVVCVDSNFTACLAGWELPDAGDTRRFEAIWSTDSEAVRATLEVALSAAGPPLRDRGETLLRELANPAGDTAPTLALANRMVGYLAGPND
jgi:DNA-binding transcriptional MerR regulator